MDILGLQDKLARALGVAARKLGVPTTVYRPMGLSQPIGEHRRVIQILAAFEPQARSANSKGLISPVWQGTFDTLYTQPGDYLVNSSQTFFIGSQTPALGVQCILTNRVVSSHRPVFSPQGGYSGVSGADSQALLSGWPASFVNLSASQSAPLAGGRSLGTWIVLLPVVPAVPRAADIITDDLGSTYTVETAEQAVLGWRLIVRQIGA